MLTKICGLSDPESIRQLAALHPSMMGFIFYAFSPRNACALLPSVVDEIPPEIERVGVFVDAPLDHIFHVADRYGLSTIQLHGKESADTCRELRAHGLKVMKAFGIEDTVDWETLRPYEGNVDRFIFDTATAYHGGSGRKFDWSVLNDYTLTTPFLLSGGIGPDDAQAVREAAASLPLMAGVDINSRFETRPGCKSPELVKAFMAAL